MTIESEAINCCAWCGAPGDIILTHCHDYLCGLPGEWSFRQCDKCRALWLDPRPTLASIPALYPSNYKFTRTSLGVQLADPGTLSGAAKLTLLDRCFGYSAPERKSVLGALAGNLLASYPPARRKAGYSVRFLPKKQDGHLLDVGCGNGAFLELMQSLGWNVEGIEPDPAAAVFGRARGLTIHGGNVQDAPLEAARYDAITLAHVSEHLALPREDFTRLVHALKPGGVLVSISPNPRSLLRSWFARHWYSLDPPRHLTIPSGQSYAALLEPLGCDVRTCTSMRMVYWILRESYSIHATGGPGVDVAAVRLHALNAILSTLGPLLPNRGEEVICYAERR